MLRRHPRHIGPSSSPPSLTLLRSDRSTAAPAATVAAAAAAHVAWTTWMLELAGFPDDLAVDSARARARLSPVWHVARRAACDISLGKFT